ncbi:hypothetical protein kam1_758 [Methylacidiphilum kamchatkense Kam1]|uniref:Tetratricopeptide repeat protein n=2 Tax=Methylacidiphilum kamchatkense TaxID=431057 RepID=A0A516TL80_9BACT|nr:hypothetical protein kam1_758 [Methylacidiphilum kamchatkense Kam1]
MGMTFQEFLELIEKEDTPPSSLSAPLQALFYEKKGQWARAHNLIQRHEDTDSCWVHAFLHRKEGDIPNSKYWYARAGKAMGKDFDSEWKEIVLSLIEKGL